MIKNPPYKRDLKSALIEAVTFLCNASVECPICHKDMQVMSAIFEPGSDVKVMLSCGIHDLEMTMHDIVCKKPEAEAQGRDT
jgi:hypothetical protein